ncbi:MAG: amidohydrolase family protein [Acidobacteriaceae bacterium]|nr:amidohydrolase family protein [Acidobacteriaceae bacterium]
MTSTLTRILDELGIETVIANRVAMPPYLDKKRFRWAFFVDSFLFPFDNTDIRDRNVDEQVYVPLQEKKLRRELRQAGLERLPVSLDEYLRFITRILQMDRANEGIAIKFEIAYFRSLRFGDPPPQQAAAIYQRYSGGGKPTPDQYTAFQNFIARYLFREAGRLHLAVHFHTSVGIGDYFNLRNGSVMNLENVLRDPRYDSVDFVLLHGGFPHDREAIWLTARKSVYLDSSLVELYLYPSEFKNVLKQWLSIYPDKVLFGSDAFPFNEALGAEEGYWLGVRSARQALAGALGELVAEHAFSQEEAMRIARGYLHDNATRLYEELMARSQR